LLNTLTSEKIDELITNLKSFEKASILVSAQKISEKQFNEILTKFVSKDYRNKLTSLYMVNEFIKPKNSFINKNFDNIEIDFLKFIKFPRSIFEKKLLSDLNGIDGASIWEYELDDDFVADNYENFRDDAVKLIIANKYKIGKSVLTKTNFIKDLISRANSISTTDYYWTNAIVNSIVEVTKNLKTEDLLDIIREIGESIENLAINCMAEILRRVDVRILNEYELLEINMFIDRNSLNLFYGNLIDEMPGLKLLLSLE